MIKKLKVTVMALLAGVTMSFAQTADEIIARHIDALGGKEKLANLKSLKMKAMVDVGPNMKAPMTLFIVNEKSLRMEFEMQGLTMIQCIDGDSGWAIQPFGGKKEAERMDKETIDQMKDELYLTGSLYNYKEKGNIVTLLGKEDMEGTDVFKLKVVKKNGDVETVFIDAGSYLKLKEISKHTFKDKEVQSEKVFSNYKKVDGLMIAFTVDDREVGAAQGQAVTFDTIEVNPKFESSLFKMPTTEGAILTPTSAEKK